jgi:hypothetical protein
MIMMMIMRNPAPAALFLQSSPPSIAQAIHLDHQKRCCWTEFLSELRGILARAYRSFCPQGSSRMKSFFGCHWRSWVAADLAYLISFNIITWLDAADFARQLWEKSAALGTQNKAGWLAAETKGTHHFCFLEISLTELQMEKEEC